MYFWCEICVSVVEYSGFTQIVDNPNIVDIIIYYQSIILRFIIFRTTGRSLLKIVHLAVWHRFRLFKIVNVCMQGPLKFIIHIDINYLGLICRGLTDILSYFYIVFFCHIPKCSFNSTSAFCRRYPSLCTGQHSHRLRPRFHVPPVPCLYRRRRSVPYVLRCTVSYRSSYQHFRSPTLPVEGIVHTFVTAITSYILFALWFTAVPYSLLHVDVLPLFRELSCESCWASRTGQLQRRRRLLAYDPACMP